MQMSCSRWWILPENMETDRFILPHARDLKLKESIWKIWIKLMRCFNRSLIIFRSIKMRQVPGIQHQEPEMSVHVSETESALLEIIIQQLFAKRIEKAIFPNDLHFKIALTGCANDCIKARMHDFGIIGMTEPQYDPDRCVSCGACVKGCDKLSVDALKMDNYRIVRNEEK